MIDDEYIKNYILTYKEITGKRPIFKSFENTIKEYILNRYVDSDSYQESIYRILNDIHDKPKCKYCGKLLKFKGRGKGSGFGKYCSCYCEAKDISTFKNSQKIKDAVFKKYGVDNVFKLKETRDKAKQTKIDLYGDENYNNHQKIYSNMFR